ncbi:hypothetical protein B566_EDAN015362 [Ephemera danica]|nr:hypothetical protein B566_EDAN015362 [Ephemera danica]
MHEMMHALGIFHEQSRADRDQFIRVRKEHNFKQHDKYFGFGQAYDYESVRSVPNIGQRNGFSKADIAKINNLYGCNEIKSNEIETKLTPPTPRPNYGPGPDYERPRPNCGPGPDYERPRPNYGKPDFRPSYGKPDYGRPDFEKNGYGRPDYERPGYGGRPQFPGNSITSFEKSFVISSGRNYHKDENEIAIALTEDVEKTTKATYTTTPATKTTRKKFFGIF